MIVGQVEEAEETSECTFKGIPVPCPPEKEVVEISDFYMEVNSGSCSTCVSWAYIGKEYNFQIETYDEKRGNYIDGVKINVKIISKGGELRHNFGQVTTEDGIYKNSITIPSLDWYADNILSVTGEYNGVEKTIEKEFTVFKRGYSADPSSIDAAQNSGGSCTEVSPLAINSKVGWPGYTFTNGEGNPQGLAFSEDGTKMFVVGRDLDRVFEYILGGSITNSSGTFSFPGPYCLGTAHKIAAFNFAPHASESGPNGIVFSTNGLKMFIVGNDRDRVYEYKLTENFVTNGTGTGYGISSSTTLVTDFSVNSQDNDAQAIAFSTNGTRMFIVGTQNDSIYAYKLTEHLDISTASYADESLDIDAMVTASDDKNEDSPTGIAFSNDGLKMFVVGDERDSVHEFKLTEHFGISTASYVDSFDCSNEETAPRDLAFDYSGRYMFILGKSGDDVTVYKLSEPFDVSTAVVQSG
jgi:sugar lactone lactonase YvrE